jgi:hypothetical protein
MRHTKIPNIKGVFNGRSMVTRHVKQKGGNLTAYVELPEGAIAHKPTEARQEKPLDKKALQAKLMQEVYKNL